MRSFVLICMIAACSPSHKHHPEMPFDKQGHRGCRSLMPENTIPAMIKAIDLGVTTIEMDVVITKDSQVVLSHEPFFSHEISTKPDGTYVSEAEEKKFNIFGMNYDEVMLYDVGLKPHPRFPLQHKLKAHKPLLNDVIDSVEEYCKTRNQQILYNIETKTLPFTDNLYHPAPALFCDLLMNVINSKNVMGRVTIQSFDIRTLQYIHHKYPLVSLALLIDEGDKRILDDQIEELGFDPDIYSPHYAHVTDELIHSCQQRKIRVIPWTVNDATLIKRLIDLKVDGVITDDPSLFLR